MGVPLLAAVGLAYLWVAYEYWTAQRYGMLLVFVGYALGNLGFIIDAVRK